VRAFCEIEPRLSKGIAQRDPEGTADAFRTFNEARFHYASIATLKALGNMGPTALPALKKLLADEALLHWHGHGIIEAVGGAGGAEAAAELVAVVEQESAFWQRRGPTLKKGWWNGDPADERKVLREHYSKLLQALRTLRPLRYAPCRDAVSSVRACWLSHQALDQIGESQMAHACDAVLRDLPTRDGR